MILVKQTQNFAWAYIIILVIVICLLMEKKYLSRKPIIKILTFQFCLGSISNGFSATESREVFLNGTVYDFSVDHNCIDKSDIINIYKYLMIENNIK